MRWKDHFEKLCLIATKSLLIANIRSISKFEIRTPPSRVFIKGSLIKRLDLEIKIINLRLTSKSLAVSNILKVFGNNFLPTIMLELWPFKLSEPNKSSESNNKSLTSYNHYSTMSHGVISTL